MTVLFLYTELADYFLQCCDELSKSANVHIVRWPVNKEAPFKFNFSEQLKIYNKNEFTLQQLNLLVDKINPDVIVCSGWIDKDYMKIARTWTKKIPTVLTLDTHWKNSLKQWLAVSMSPFFIRTVFSHAWVPGNIQALYAKKLGFSPQNIKQGFYCCDLDKFNLLFEKQKVIRQTAFPKRFLYVGRYYEFKGITDLWEAFIAADQEQSGQWELWCLGNGDIEPINHPSIKHFGFVQPADLEPIIMQCGVFILPSRFEPWGVVVQEYAAAGFPMLLSKDVGAAEAFLEDGKNGYLFEAGQVEALKNQLKKIMNLSDKELLLMSDKSHGLAQKITKQAWVSVVKQIYNAHKQN